MISKAMIILCPLTVINEQIVTDLRCFAQLIPVIRKKFLILNLLKFMCASDKFLAHIPPLVIDTRFPYILCKNRIAFFGFLKRLIEKFLHPLVFRYSRILP